MEADPDFQTEEDCFWDDWDDMAYAALDQCLEEGVEADLCYSQYGSRWILWDGNSDWFAEDYMWNRWSEEEEYVEYPDDQNEVHELDAQQVPKSTEDRLANIENAMLVVLAANSNSASSSQTPSGVAPAVPQQTPYLQAPTGNRANTFVTSGVIDDDALLTFRFTHVEFDMMSTYGQSNSEEHIEYPDKFPILSSPSRFVTDGLHPQIFEKVEKDLE
jgi:hypothetical protein